MWGIEVHQKEIGKLWLIKERVICRDLLETQLQDKLDWTNIRIHGCKQEVLVNIGKSSNRPLEVILT